MSSETRSLLNPAFGAHLLSSVAEGHQEESGAGLPFLLAFIAPSLLLNSETRARLPKVITSKLSEWAGSNPSIIAELPRRIRELQTTSGNAVLVGHSLGWITIDDQRRIVRRKADSYKKLASLHPESSELSDIFKKGFLLGRIFSRAGTEPTIFNILGLGIFDANQ